jgi:hypothetical protein
MTTTLLNEPRTSTLSRREVVEKYPEVSPFVILKTDLQRRSVTYTERALAAVDPQKHQVQINSWAVDTSEHASVTFPASLLLRDGTLVLTGPRPSADNPYVVDHIDGRTVIVDDGEVVEEAEFWPRHEFYDKFTSSGKPMWLVAGFSRPQRIDFNPYFWCHFWDNGEACRYCSIGSTFQKAKKSRNREVRVSPQDIYETTREAVKQPGRYMNIVLTGGSIPGADNSFEDEVQVYIETLQAIGANFSTRRFPSQLIASSFNEDQLARIYEQTGLSTWTTDLEVLDEEKFNWICPGKASRVGFKEWRRRLIAAVGIFGRGRVVTGIVGGVETAPPHGFPSEGDGLAATLESAEELANHGVSTVSTVWQPCPGSNFQNLKAPSLEYYVRLAKGLDELRRRYRLNVDMDDYRYCGNHPDSDLSRI